MQINNKANTRQNFKPLVRNMPEVVEIGGFLLAGLRVKAGFRVVLQALRFAARKVLLTKEAHRGAELGIQHVGCC